MFWATESYFITQSQQYKALTEEAGNDHLYAMKVTKTK